MSSAEAAAIANFPFLGLPVIKQIFDVIVRGIGSKMIQALEQSASIGIIDFGDATQNQAAKDAALALYAAQNNPATTAAELEAAKDGFKKTYAALISMHVATPVK